MVAHRDVIWVILEVNHRNRHPELIFFRQVKGNAIGCLR
jgi:hypothetical protein